MLVTFNRSIGGTRMVEVVAQQYAALRSRSTTLTPSSRSTRPCSLKRCGERHSLHFAKAPSGGLHQTARYGAVHDCGVGGDRRRNGLVDCSKPACARAPACQPACGDGVKDPWEVCDDGNRFDGDCCATSCTLPRVWQRDLEQPATNSKQPLQLNGSIPGVVQRECKFHKERESWIRDQTSRTIASV